jgi:diguanylate cyclase
MITVLALQRLGPRADEHGMEPSVGDFRPSAARWLADGGVLGLLPFAVADVLAGERALATAMFAMIAVLVFCGWWIRRGSYSPLVIVVVFVIPATVVNATAVSHYGVYVTYWAFVVVVATFLVLPERWAWICNLVFVAAIVSTAWIAVGGVIASRFGVSLVMIAVFGALAVRLIDQRQRLLARQVVTDPLTGLLNRMTLTEVLHRSIAAGAANRRSATLLAIDVDHFKSINDTYGHEAGDRVLVGLARHLEGETRGDVPVFRVGGEEFLVVLDGTGQSDAEVLAARLVAGIAAACFLDDRSVTVSIGVAAMDPDERPHDWMRRADEALYRAKQRGRNTLAA